MLICLGAHSRHNVDRMTKRPLKETLLDAPVRSWLKEQGYRVRGEVGGCDLVATKGEEMVVIELKLGFNTALLIQATQRQKLTDSVYVALLRPESGFSSQRWKGIRHLLRRLELGLILVDPEGGLSGVQVVFHPVPFQPRRDKKRQRAILREAAGRTEDYNLGGTTRRKIVTAYRESALVVACLLEHFGPLRPRDLRALGTGPKTLSILADNHYAWFERIDRGLYALKASAPAQMQAFPDLLAACRQAAANASLRPTAKRGNAAP
jgi:hypothetical protein